jgi:integrase
MPQFFFGRMRYLLFVNPGVFENDAPAAGVRAIVAHELGHILYFKKRNRLRLTGLVRLASRRFTARFERWADLTAISLGYADGLKEYRNWLYRHVPVSKLEEKHRNYFSPEEIDAILSAAQRRPALLEYWFRHVPLSLSDIQAARLEP